MNENDERNEIIKAAEQGDAEWAEEAMERVWSDETLGGKTRLKVDYSDQLKSDNNNFT